MASIAKRPDGRWRARYRDADGREHARHFPRRTDAQRWLDEVTAAVVTGQYVDPRAGRVTFRAYAEQWRTAAPHGPAMRDKVARALTLHAYPVLGDRPLSGIRSSAVQGWVAGLSVAPATAKVMLGYVSAVFRAAVRDRLIATNPAEGVRPRSARKSEVFIPDLATVAVLREHLPSRFRAVVDLVIGSGLRHAEVFGLELDALDFLRGRSVAVRQQLVSLSPEPLHLAGCKSESGRVVPLAQCTLDAMAAHLAAYPPRPADIEDRIDPRKPTTRPAALVFTSARGHPISRSMWSQTWRPAARAAGLPERTGLHALRHTYASLLIHHGESVKVVQRRLGHSSAAITLDTYAHLWPDSDDRTRDAVEAALSAAADPVRTERVQDGF